VSPFRRVLPLVLLSLIALTTASAQPAPGRAPVPLPADELGKSTTAPHAMVAAANPLAVEAGLRVLRDGGSAVDLTPNDSSAHSPMWRRVTSNASQ